jgi:hypothetical protein
MLGKTRNISITVLVLMHLLLGSNSESLLGLVVLWHMIDNGKVREHF